MINDDNKKALVLFGKEFLSLGENGEVTIFDNKQKQKKMKTIKSNRKIQPIQYNKSNEKVLIQTANGFDIIDLKSNDIFFLNLEIQNLINIFWSQIEENLVIVVYDNKIELMYSEPEYYKILKSYKINNLTNCKNCQSGSILSQFSLISLIDEKELCLITPFVSTNFILSNFSFEELKEALPNVKDEYFDECFVANEKGFYEFDSLFGIDIEPTCYPLNLNVNKYGSIADFSFRNDYIMVLFENKLIVKLSLSFPSLFDYKHVINVKCEELEHIDITHFISTGSYLFGIGKSYSIQFFNECAIQVHDQKQIVGVNKSNVGEDGLRKLTLLFSDGKVNDYFDDESIYYESKLNERLKNLQRRKQIILQKKLNMQQKLNQFQSEISKLVSIDKIKSLQNRVSELKNLLIQTNENKDIDINQIQDEIPQLNANISNAFNKHSKILDDKEKEIDGLKKELMDSNAFNKHSKI